MMAGLVKQKRLSKDHWCRIRSSVDRAHPVHCLEDMVCRAYMQMAAFIMGQVPVHGIHVTNEGRNGYMPVSGKEHRPVWASVKGFEACL